MPKSCLGGMVKRLNVNAMNFILNVVNLECRSSYKSLSTVHF